MLQISGKVINVFTLEAGTDKDGNDYAERHKVQLLGDVALKNGETRLDLMDLTVEDLSDWQSLVGSQISIQIGAFSPSKGSIIYFVLKGAKPQVLE